MLGRLKLTHKLQKSAFPVEATIRSENDGADLKGDRDQLVGFEGDPDAVGKTVDLSNSETFGKFMYECVMTLLIFWNCLEIPFRLAFFPPYPFDYFIVGAMIDWIFITDCVVRFYLPFLSKSGYFITDRAAIRKHYLRTWFTVDAISSIPWDFILLVLVMADPVFARSLTFFRYVRVTRIVRLFSIIARLREWEITINWNINLLWIRGARLGLSLVLWMNAAACVYGLIASSEGFAHSWPNDAPAAQAALDAANPFYLYQASLYFAVITFTTIGYGDYTPTTTGERAFTFFYIFCNIWILTITIGTVTSWLQQAEKARTALADKLDDVKNYCRFRGLPNDLSADMMRFFRFKASVKGYEGSDFDQLVDLTPSLRGEVADYLRMTVMAKWGLPRVLDRQFLTALVLRLRRERRSQGEYLTLQGTAARKFFIITAGTAVLMKNETELLQLSGEGCCFGEKALFFDSIRRTATIRAITTCDLLTITRADMLSLLELFPQHQTRIQEYADRLEDTFQTRNPDLFLSRNLRRTQERISASQRQEPESIEMDDMGEAVRNLALPDYSVEDVSGAVFSPLVMRRLTQAMVRNGNTGRFFSLARRFRSSGVSLDSDGAPSQRRRYTRRGSANPTTVPPKAAARRKSIDVMESSSGIPLTPLRDSTETLQESPIKKSNSNAQSLRKTEPSIGRSSSNVAEGGHGEESRRFRAALDRRIDDDAEESDVVQES